MRRHDQRRRQVLRREVIRHRARHRIDIGDTRDRRRTPSPRSARTDPPARAMRQPGAGRDQLPRMLSPSARAASPPDPPATDRAATRGGSRSASVCRLIRAAPRAEPARSVRRTCRPPAPADRAPSVQPPASGSGRTGRACARTTQAQPPPPALPAGTAPAGATKNPQNARPPRAVAGVRCRSNSRSRQCRISFGSGMRTGQTLSHLPQKVEAFGRCPAWSTPIRTGRQHRPHRTRINPAIGMAADRAIDRAMVHAGGATDAAQHVLELGAEHRRAAVVHQHHVIFLRPIQIARPPRAGGERGVDGKILPGRRARQHAQQRRAVLQRRHAFLDAGQHDVHARQGLRQIAVALIGDDDAAAGLGDQEIGAGDADIGGQEPFAAVWCAPRSGCRGVRRTRGRPAGRCATCGRPSSQSSMFK